MTTTIRQDDGVPEFFTGRVDYTTRNGRESHYYLLDGEKVEGVTSIIKGGTPRPEALQRWDRAQGAQAAVDQKRIWSKMEPEAAVKFIASRSDETLHEAANRGTTVHGWADVFATTGALPSDVPDHLAGRAEAFETFVQTWCPEYLLVEKVVFNNLHLYAGTLDAVCVLPGLGNTLIDYKTAKRVYQENALQLAAYRYATFWIGDDDGVRYGLPRIDVCAVVLLNDDGTHSVTPVTAGRMEFATFLKAKALYEFSRFGKTVVGRPLPTP